LTSEFSLKSGDALARIAMGARSQSRLFMISLARMLRERHGSEIHLYCAGPQEVEFYQTQNKNGLFASINDASVEYRNLFDEVSDEDEVFERARRYEQMLGVTINRLIVPDRHLGRGYALGGFYHPRSRYSEGSSYVQAVKVICDRLAYWETEFTAKKIGLCLNGSDEAAWIARQMNMPYRALARSRIENLHYWSTTEKYETPVFEKRWREPGELKNVPMKKPYHSHLASRKRYQKSFSFATMVRNSARSIAQYGYWNLRGYQKAKGYYLSENLQLFWRTWREYKRVRRIATATLKDLSGKKFVYFPMHVEPETALHGFSPEYFYQHALIAAVSRDLPAGVFLAVKEAYGAIGRRPANFYEQIADLKNVILLDPWEIGLACAQTADAVVTICGTAGLEAVAAGTPVIAFGQHNLYNFLPSVRVVTNEADLPGYLAHALDKDTSRAEIKAEGERLLAAIADRSFDMLSYDYINVSSFDAEAVTNACDAIELSLSETAVAAEA